VILPWLFGCLLLEREELILLLQVEPKIHR
jgi:hypothetical protein